MGTMIGRTGKQAGSVDTLRGYGMVGVSDQRWDMHGYTPDKDRYLARLRRIEGQVRGLDRKSVV